MTVTFEVERFEWAADDRLELEGRWFGLRGRRFIRPTLDVEVDGKSRRLLALMEHKPWAALDGEEWVAAFAWEGEPGEIDAELAVGADLSFELPQPNGAKPAPARTASTRTAAKAANGKTSRKRGSSGRAARSRADGNGGATPALRITDSATGRKLADAEAARTELAAEVAALRRALDQKDRTVRDLHDQLATARDEASAARDEATAARGAADAATEHAAAHDFGALTRELNRVRAELDTAHEQLATARAQLDTAPTAEHKAVDLEHEGARIAELAAVREELAATHKELVEARREAKAARETPNEQMHALRQQLEATIAARDAAIEYAEKAKRERYEAAGTLAGAEREAQGSARALELVQAERDDLRHTLRAARHERDAALEERDAALARLKSTRRERDSAQLAHAADKAERPLVTGVAEAIRHRGPRALVRLNSERSHDEVMAMRVGALGALSIVCLLVAIWILAF